MAQFDDSMSAAADAMVGTFAGETAADTYTPSGGTPRLVRGWITSDPPNRDGKGTEARASIHYTAKISNVDGLPADPNYGGDTLRVASLGKTFLVKRSDRYDAGDRSLITVELR